MTNKFTSFLGAAAAAVLLFAAAPSMAQSNLLILQGNVASLQAV